MFWLPALAGVVTVYLGDIPGTILFLGLAAMNKPATPPASTQGDRT